MNKKWYIIIFVVTLAFLSGVVTQERISIPNQEIVLYFDSNTVNSDEVEETISKIKHQLEITGVSNIQVTKFDDDKLYISYHSTSQIYDIKRILSQSDMITLNQEFPSSIPSKDSKTSFNFDVYEIETDYNTDVNILGIITSSSSKGDYKQNIQVDPFATIKSNKNDCFEFYETKAYKFYTQEGVVLSCNSYKIPEVRAGPSFLG